MDRGFVKLFRRLKPFDRRKDIRFQIVHNIQCVCEYTKSEQQVKCQAWICDISNGGLLITTGEEKIYPGAVVTIRFQIPSCQKTISVTEKIIRTYRRRTEHWYYSAVRFQNREEPEIKELLDFALRESRA